MSFSLSTRSLDKGMISSLLLTFGGEQSHPPSQPSSVELNRSQLRLPKIKIILVVLTLHGTQNNIVVMKTGKYTIENSIVTLRHFIHLESGRFHMIEKSYKERASIPKPA